MVFKKGQTGWNKGLKNCQKSDRKGKTYEEIYGTEKASEIKKKTFETKKKKHLIPWNKGLTKETDERVKKYSITSKENRSKKDFKEKMKPIYIDNGKKLKLKFKEGKVKPNSGTFKKGIKVWSEGKHLSEVTKKKVSDSMKDQYKSGKRVTPTQGKHHTEESKKKNRESQKKLWSNEKYAKEMVRKMLNGLIKRPTSYEQKISYLCVKYNLPFIYTGNGTFLIGHKNPDFVNEGNKIAIEVYNDYFKIRDFGSCENYEKQRSEYFTKYGYRTIFIRKEHVMAKNWEEICLNLIKSKI